MRHPTPASWCLLLCLSLAILLFPTRSAEAQPLVVVWNYHPPLSYFALDGSLQAPLRMGARLSPAQFAQVQRIATGEQAQLRRQLEASQSIVANPTLSLEQKRLYIQLSGYNRQVQAILYTSDQALRQALDPAAYTRMVSWMDRRWPLEVRLHGIPPARLDYRLLPDLLSWIIPLSAPRTYEIFATRYDSKGRYTAALPDQCVKLTNGGLRTCADKGYIAGQRYEIFMSYKNGNKGVGLVVAETGPWNIDDNFWATLADPTPRRMFADLPLGMPESQAAFYNGYNGGLDQYGRKVTAPFAIDLAFEVADDLGLPSKTNDWINVSFMWTDGWGSGAAPGSAAGQSGGAQPAAISPVETAAFKLDGSQVHTVQAGETLWAIAIAYGVTIQRLRELNSLPVVSADDQSAVILPGQQLIVRPAGPTPTNNPSISGSATSVTPTIDSHDPGAPTSLAEVATRPSPTFSIPDPGALTSKGELVTLPSPIIGTPVPSETLPARITGLDHSSTSLVLYIIAGLLLSGVLLYALGRWLSAR